MGAIKTFIYRQNFIVPVYVNVLSNGLINAIATKSKSRVARTRYISGHVDEDACLLCPFTVGFLFSDTQGGREEVDCLLVHSRFRGWTPVAGPRGLHARLGPRAAADYHGVLLHEHLLGDLARHETPVSYDIATCVSPRFHFPFPFESLKTSNIFFFLSRKVSKFDALS